jgi:DNA-binding GntR family transcriptional regulator
VSVRATDADRADMRARVASMRERADAGDIDGYFWGHVALQSRMTQITGNGTLQWVLDSLAMRTLILRHASLEQPGRLQASVADQELILSAIEDRDPELAAMLLARSTRAALRAIEDRDDLGS